MLPVGGMEYKKSVILAGEHIWQSCAFSWICWSLYSLVYGNSIFMNIALSLFFLFGLIAGQMGALSIGNGITVYLMDIALFGLVAYSLFHLPKNIPLLYLRMPIVLFGAACLVSLIANIARFSPIETLTGSLYAFRWIGYATLYLIVFILPQRPIWWFWGLYSTGVSVAMLGLIQYFWYPYLRNLSYLGWDPHLYRVFSTLFDPNFASLLFVLTLWLGMYLWSQKKHLWIVGLGEGVTLIALLLTYSRSGYLALICGILTIAVISRHTKYALLVIVLFLGLLVFLPRKDGEGVKLFRTVSSVARVGNWQRGATLIKEAPLLGHGFNTLRYVQRKYGWVDDTKMVSHAGAGLDNSLEFIWATTGILGLGIYLWMLTRMFHIGSLSVQSAKYRPLGTVVIATLVSVLVHSQFSNSLFFPQIMMWVWVLLGAFEKSISFGTSRVVL